MHGRRGNYMLCKWKRKKGGCHGQPSRKDGREGGYGWILYRGDACTIENVNSLVFLVAFVSLQNLPSVSLLHIFFFLHPHFRGSFPNLPSSFIVFLPFFFSSPPVHPAQSHRRKSSCGTDGRTELILRARKAKGGPPSLELHGALAITPAKRGSSRQSFCKRLLNIRTRVVGIPLRDSGDVDVLTKNV